MRRAGFNRFCFVAGFFYSLNNGGIVLARVGTPTNGGVASIQSDVRTEDARNTLNGLGDVARAVVGRHAADGKFGSAFSRPIRFDVWQCGHCIPSLTQKKKNTRGKFRPPKETRPPGMPAGGLKFQTGGSV